MNPKNSYASKATLVQTCILFTVLFSILVCTICMPAMAQSDSNDCKVSYPPDEDGMRLCTMQYCGPVITPTPLPPCCVYGPYGQPLCYGFGMCMESPFPNSGNMIMD